jgi:hypothetical protein
LQIFARNLPWIVPKALHCIKISCSNIFHREPWCLRGLRNTEKYCCGVVDYNITLWCHITLVTLHWTTSEISMAACVLHHLIRHLRVKTSRRLIPSLRSPPCMDKVHIATTCWAFWIISP